MDSPNFFRPPAAEFKGSKDPRIQDLKDRLLREEGRRGTVVVVGIDEPVGAELHPVDAEAEERRVREVAIGLRSILVTGAVDVEIVVVHQPLRMSEQHDADGERTETVLVDLHDLACPANRATAMPQTELSRNDEDVVILLLVAERLEHLLRPGRLLEPIGTEFAFAPVLELALARLADLREHLLHGFAVGRGNRLPLRDGEPSFRVSRNRPLGQLLVGETDAREQLPQDVRLLRDALRLVAGEISVARLHFLVLELVGDRQVLQRGDGGRADGLGEIVAVFDDALCAGVVEAELSENLLDGVGTEPVDLLDLTGRCCRLSNRVHCVISFWIS